MPSTSPWWVGLTGGDSTMVLPAGEKDVRHAFDYDPTPYMKRITGGVIEDGEGFRIHSASLHMHTLGTEGELQIPRSGVEAECLLDVDRWDFGWQRSYAFAEPKAFQPGDRLFLECHWDNSGARHPRGAEPHEVGWGERTGDEMCLGVLYVSEL